MRWPTRGCDGKCLWLGFEGDDPGSGPTVVDLQQSEGDGEIESARTDASGVEIEHAAAVLYQRLVGVAAKDNADSCSVRVEVEVVKGVEHVKQAAGEFDGLGGGQGGAGAGAVDVAANRGDWSDAAEFSEDLRVADVASV